MNHPPVVRRALIVVDMQNDFIDGSLAVPDAPAIIPVIRRVLGQFDLVVFTKDWHPANHGSFAASHPGKAAFERIDLNGLPQTLWPVHCVQGTHGAELAAGFDVAGVPIILKGTDLGIDSYSGFADNGGRKQTGLRDLLESNNVSEVYICGLATDYCVKATALDAVKSGFLTHLIEDACRGVEQQAGDVQKAIDEMRAAGVRILASDDLETAEWKKG